MLWVSLDICYLWNGLGFYPGYPWAPKHRAPSHHLEPRSSPKKFSHRKDGRKDLDLRGWDLSLRGECWWWVQSGAKGDWNGIDWNWLIHWNWFDWFIGIIWFIGIDLIDSLELFDSLELIWLICFIRSDWNSLRLTCNSKLSGTWWLMIHYYFSWCGTKHDLRPCWSNALRGQRCEGSCKKWGKCVRSEVGRKGERWGYCISYEIDIYIYLQSIYYIYTIYNTVYNACYMNVS